MRYDIISPQSTVLRLYDLWLYQKLKWWLQFIVLPLQSGEGNPRHRGSANGMFTLDNIHDDVVELSQISRPPLAF